MISHLWQRLLLQTCVTFISCMVFTYSFFLSLIGSLSVLIVMLFALTIMKTIGFNVGIIVTILLLPMFCHSSMSILFLVESFAN